MQPLLSSFVKVTSKFYPPLVEETVVYIQCVALMHGVHCVCCNGLRLCMHCVDGKRAESSSVKQKSHHRFDDLWHTQCLFAFPMPEVELSSPYALGQFTKWHIPAHHGSLGHLVELC